jgi:hypothetical protein
MERGKLVLLSSFLNQLSLRRTKGNRERKGVRDVEEMMAKGY